MNWITIITFTYPHEAHMAQAYLESKGIDTIIKDELTTQVYNFYSNAIGGVKILVRESDCETGLNLLKDGGYIIEDDFEKQVELELVKIDSTTDKKSCPFCNSNNIGKNKEPNILTVFVFFVLGAMFPIFKSSYKCFDCEKKWKFVKK